MPGKRLYIGNIPSDCRERDVERFFRGYGRIKEILIMNNYGFIELESYRDADDAVHDLDGKDLLGGRVRIEFAKEPRGGSRGGRGGGDRRERGRPPVRTGYRILIENLSSKTHWKDLKEYFRSVGDVAYANAHSPRTGDGVVEFISRRDFEYALDHKDDFELDGRRLKIVSEKRRSRSESRSRSRSRSPRSRSRSRSASRSRSRSRSGSRDDRKATKKSSDRRSKSSSRSRSRSKSDHSRSASRSRSRSRSQSRD